MGCLTESIWTPKAHIKYFDTKNQLADTLTEGNFTRDEWNHLLRLFKIRNFPMLSCCHVLSTKTAEHPVEESSGKEDRITAFGTRNNPSRWIRVRRTACGVGGWVGILFSQSLGNLRDRVQNPATKNLCEGSRTSLQARSGTTTVSKSPTTSTLRKSSRTFDRS